MGTYKPRPQKACPKTGRSTGTLKYGAAKNWKPKTPFFADTLELKESIAVRELSAPARKIFDFLIIEHLRNGGAENGNLAAPYSQIEDFGVSSRDISKAFLMLDVFGLVKRTNENEFIAGRKNMARYRLTMLPDKFGNLPSDEWAKITLADTIAFKSNPFRFPN